MANKFYDKQLRAMMNILENDYAGLALGEKPVDSRYYVQATGMAWKQGTLDGLTFLRFGSQMLATTMDRSLRLSLETEGYAPWRAGFDARRVGDSLYVTAVQEEKRLRPGDRILRLNALSPDLHVRQFQKNFLYADVPEREMWGNVLKMTKHILVEHADGTQEDMQLIQYTGSRPACPPQIHTHKNGAVIVTVGDLGDGEALGALIARHKAALDGAWKVVIDLRRTHDGDEAALLPLVPYILSEAKTMSEAAGEATYLTLYTEDNCRRREEILLPYAGDETADAILADLRAKRGKGFVEETVDLWADMPDVIAPRGKETVLLIDTFTEGAAESFALLTKKEGRAKLCGRATMGSLDYADMISVALGDELTFTYPMSITRQAKEGDGYKGRGVSPDVIVPFTPGECTRDLVLEQAMA